MRHRWIANLVVSGAVLALTAVIGSAQAVRITPVGPGTSTPPPATPPPAAQPAAPTSSAPAVIVPVNSNIPAQSPTVASQPAAMPPAAAQSQAAMNARKLQVSFANGGVTVLATNVTLREILAEWSRQGGTKFVDAEKLAGGPVSFEFR